MRKVIWTIAYVFLLPGVVHAGDLQVEVRGVRNASGNVLGAVFDSSASFLQVSQSKGRCKATAASGNVTCVFHNLPAGRWAVSVFHDENDNGKLDRNSFNNPIEGYGFSNDAQGSFGPPTFDQAAFNFNGQTQTVPIDLDYPH